MYYPFHSYSYGCGGYPYRGYGYYDCFPYGYGGYGGYPYGYGYHNRLWY